MRAWQSDQDGEDSPPGPRVPPGLQIAAAITWRVLLLLAGLAVLAYIVGYLAELVVPLGIALLLAALLTPAVRQLAAWRVPRSLAVVLAVIGGLAAVGGVLYGVINAFLVGLPELQTQLAGSLQTIDHWLAAGPLHLRPRALQTAFTQAIGELKHNQAELASGVLSTALTAGRVLTGLLLTIFTLIFFLRDGDPIWRFLTLAAPAGVRPRVVAAGRAGFATLTHYVRATAVVAIGDAVGIGVGLVIVGVPLAVPLAALVFLGAFIPIIGSVLAGTVAVLVALVAKGLVPALIMAGIVLAVMQFEGNVLQPLLLGRAVRLHPLAIVLAIAAGALLAGIPGALLAGPVLAVVNTAVRTLLHYPQTWPPAAQPTTRTRPLSWPTRQLLPHRRRRSPSTTTHPDEPTDPEAPGE